MCTEEHFIHITEDLAQKELFSFSSVVLEGQCHPSSSNTYGNNLDLNSDSMLRGLMQPMLKPSSHIPYFPLKVSALQILALHSNGQAQVLSGICLMNNRSSEA